MSDEPKQRGGARPGAGAPKKGLHKLVAFIQPATDAKIRDVATREGLTLGEVIDQKFSETAG